MTKHAAKLFIRFYFGQMSCGLPTATSLFICELPREKVEHFVPSLNYSQHIINVVGLTWLFQCFFYLNRLQGQRTNRNKAITLGEMHFVVGALTECIYNLLTCVYISFIILPLIALFTSVHFSSGQNAFYLVFKSVLFIKLDRCTCKCKSNQQLQKIYIEIHEVKK